MTSNITARIRVSRREHRQAIASELKKGIRGMTSRLFGKKRQPVEFQLFVDADVVPSLSPPKYKRDLWLITIRQCVFEVVAAGLVEQCIADSHHRSSTPPLRIRCWDTLYDNGWVDRVIGSELSAKVTRYVATARLLTRRKLWELKMLDAADDVPDLIVLSSDAGPVDIRERLELKVARDPNDLNKPDPRAMRGALEYLRDVESLIVHINHCILRHSWLAFRTVEGIDGNPLRVPFQPSVTLKQIHSREIDRAVRLYTTTLVSAQCMSKQQRAGMLIDGQRVVELDFSCHHIRMLYHSLRLDPKGDLYRPQLIFPTFHHASPDDSLKSAVRGFIKMATATTLNNSSRNDARGAIFGILNDDCSREVRHVIFDVEKSGPDDVLSRIEKAHPALVAANKLYTDSAQNLMTIDGKIMLHILSQLADKDIPALGIHDSLVVRAGDARVVKPVMEAVYRMFKTFRPVIK